MEQWRQMGQQAVLGYGPGLPRSEVLKTTHSSASASPQLPPQVTLPHFRGQRELGSLQSPQELKPQTPQDPEPNREWKAGEALPHQPGCGGGGQRPHSPGSTQALWPEMGTHTFRGLGKPGSSRWQESSVWAELAGLRVCVSRAVPRPLPPEHPAQQVIHPTVSWLVSPVHAQGLCARVPQACGQECRPH